MFKRFLSSFFKDHNDITIQSLLPLVEQIRQKQDEYSKYSDADLQAMTSIFMERIASGENTDSILIEAFATVCDAARRLTETSHTFEVQGKEVTWNMIPFDVQLMGGIILHRGSIAEMKTGEGKTLVSVLPIYLHALENKGVHVVTVNEYLAKRDASWMGELLNFLGITVGCIEHGMNHAEKKQAYNCHVTYGTNSEFGFDYLRDNMAISKEKQVMRGLHYAIVDEVDSILIDEARTPLIISGPAEDSTDMYMQYAKIVRQLEKNTHYSVDEKEKSVRINDEGIARLESLLGTDNIYTDQGFEAVHHIEAALKALALFEKDKDYIVSDNQIMIVDEFTGRILPGRRYSQGLHQAIEAKEGVTVQRESKTYASITYQNFFRIYSLLSGMTGTAITEAEEFATIYGLDTYVIPTNKPIARKDKDDLIYQSTEAKSQAIINRVKTATEQKQPVLIGTVSIERSEYFSKLLTHAGIPHKVLNAKQHEKEADIIANAGLPGAVTLATNMAGRGTDIKLPPESLEAGGLLVIGTERHESRRIDNQLRGRSGRQGDPGESQFFVSMDDDLLRIFGGDRMKSMMQSLRLPPEQPIEHGMISSSLEKAQKKVEVRNYEMRKYVLQYDDIMNKHRTIMYEKRNNILSENNIQDQTTSFLSQYIAQYILTELQDITPETQDERIEQTYNMLGVSSENISYDDTIYAVKKQNTEILVSPIIQNLEQKLSHAQEEIKKQILKNLFLGNLDRLWMDHIDNMTKLRETVSLRAYANKNPLNEYKSEAFHAFKHLLQSIAVSLLQDLERVSFEQTIAEEKSILDTRELTMSTEAKENNDQIKTSGNDVYPAVGRNDPCPCGSGKKYKKCHGQ